MARPYGARGGLIGLLVGAAALLMVLVGAPPALAAGEIESFSVTPSSTQAGGHPDLSVAIALAEPGAPEVARTLQINTPAGLALLPHAVPKCSGVDWALTQCPTESQVGLVTVHANYEGEEQFLVGTAPIYAVAPTPGQYGRFGFVIPTVNLPVTVPVGVRSGSDYGAGLSAENLPQLLPTANLDLETWGVPADPVHDSDRFPTGAPGDPAGCPGLADASCNPPTVSNSPLIPLVNNPTVCSVALSATLDLQTYQDPDAVTRAESPFPSTTGCDQLSFNPSLEVTPSTDQVRTPAGLGARLIVPQLQSPNIPSASQLRSLVTEFGGALRLAPGVGGREVCTEAEAGFGEEGPPACPGGSAVGTVVIDGPFVPDAISGGAYFGGLTDDGALRLFLLAGGHGLQVKLLALLGEDPVSGELLLEIAELPQLPIEEIDLTLSSAAGLLVTSNHCDEYAVRSLATPWNADLASQSSTQSLTLDSAPGGAACPGPPTEVAVSLAPSQITADGISVTTASAIASDETGVPVAGDAVEFSSTDPGHQIGPVTDNGDGSYSARIVASTKVGASTITAIDSSVMPEVLGTAVLSQLAVPVTPAPGPSPPPSAAPTTRITKSPPRRSRKRAPVFRFSSNAVGSSFFCRLDRGPYRRCTSPTKLPRLSYGKHTFKVFARGPSGVSGSPAVRRFSIVKPQRRRSR